MIRPKSKNQVELAPHLQAYFVSCGVRGSIALYDYPNKKLIVSDSLALNQTTLPASFSKRNLDILKEVMIVEQTDKYTLRAKTGWPRDGGINNGLWAGWVETEKGPYFFATRTFWPLNYRNRELSRCRKENTQAVFRALGILRK